MTFEDHARLFVVRCNPTIPPGIDSKDLIRYIENNICRYKSSTWFAWFPVIAHYPNGSYQWVWWRTLWFFKFQIKAIWIIDQSGSPKLSQPFYNYFVYPIHTEIPTTTSTQ